VLIGFFSYRRYPIFWHKADIRLQLWLGHSDIKHTARYSELSAKPFKDFWR
jgi:hypothetical protein